MKSMILGIFVFVLFLILSCGQSMERTLQAGMENGVTLNDLSFSGEFQTLDGNTRPLKNYADKPTVIIFSNPQCEPCVGETREYMSKLKKPETNPDQVNVISMIVGESINDAHRWQNDMQVPWVTAYDHDMTLYQKMCPAGVIPCTIIKMPEKEEVYRKYGMMEFSDITRITGPWERVPGRVMFALAY